MQGNATPRRVQEICKDLALVTCRTIGDNKPMAALYKMIQIQQEIIERLDARHVLNMQFAAHLKTQLARKDEPAECGGAALRTGCSGAMDAAALDKLLAA